MKQCFFKTPRKFTSTAFFVSLFLAWGLVGTLRAQTTAQAPDFELKDAANNTFRLSEYRGEVLVLSFIPDMDSKKEGAYWLTESRRWMEAIHRKFGDSLTIVGLKEATDLPMFVPKALVRVKLRKEPFPYLIDWKGTVFDRFSVDKMFTLMVLNREGDVVYRVSDPFSSEKGKKIYAEIRRLLVPESKHSSATGHRKANGRPDDN